MTPAQARQIEWSRKPSDFRSVHTSITTSALAKICDIAKLPVLDRSDILGRGGPLSDFTREAPETFILKCAVGSYLVKTEGSKYCRYMTRLVDAKPTPAPVGPRTTEQVLADIALLMLGVESLELRNSDSLDFKEVHVSALKLALIKAYEAGHSAAKNGR